MTQLGQQYNQESIEFWNKHWAWNTIPKGGPFPEGKENLKNLTDAVGNTTVRDVGCGYGRLAGLFDPTKYIGFDISAGTIEKAKLLNTTHEFHHWNFSKLPPAETTLLYIIMLHVDDNDLNSFCELVSQNTNKIVIGDIMGREKHIVQLNRQPLCHAREPVDYFNVFKEFGFSKYSTKSALYPIYGYDLTILTIE